MYVAGAVRRKWTVVPIAAVLVVASVGFVVLTNLNNPANGRLRHDGSLRTTTVEKHWTVKRARYDACLDIAFKGEISGNARSTWGITGPTTVWENLRVHDTTISVEALRLHSDGRCEGSLKLRNLRLSQQWKSGDRDYHGARRNLVSFGRGSQASSSVRGAAVWLEGGSYGRGDSYRATVGVYVEPTFKRSNDTLAGINVEDTIELPAN